MRTTYNLVRTTWFVYKLLNPYSLPQKLERESNIFVCFKLGFKQREIVAILQSQFGINISERHLRRILCKLNLHRGEHSDIVDVATFVSSQLEKSGQQQGYRLMHLRCLLSGLYVSIHNVRKPLLLEYDTIWSTEYDLEYEFVLKKVL